MLKIVLWVVAGIVLLDVLLAVLVAGYAAIDRARGERQLRQLRAMWSGEYGRHARSAFPWTRRRGIRRRRVLAPVVIAAVALAGTAIANPEATNQLVGSAWRTLASGFHGGGARIAVSAVSVESQADDPVRASPADEVSRSPMHATEPVRHPAGSGPTGTFDDATTGSPGAQQLAAPTMLTATPVSSSSVVLLWHDSPSERAFRVERSEDLGATWTAVGTTQRNVTTFTDSGLTAATTYAYRVIAYNLRGESPGSHPAVATTIVDPPVATTLVATVTSSSEVALSWSDVGNETGFRLERSSGDGSWVAVVTTDADVLSFTDGQLAATTTYLYRIIAINAGGEGAPSEVVSVTTGPEAVGSPTDPVVEPSPS